MKTTREFPFRDLQAWYAARCDGEWEETYGVVLETLDNPGWMLTVDLADTQWEGLALERVLLEHAEDDWLDYCVADFQFSGSCSPTRLAELVAAFLDAVDAPAS